MIVQAGEVMEGSQCKPGHNLSANLADRRRGCQDGWKLLAPGVQDICRLRVQQQIWR